MRIPKDIADYFLRESMQISCNKKIAHPAYSSGPCPYEVYTGAGRGAQFFYGLLRLPSLTVRLLP